LKSNLEASNPDWRKNLYAIAAAEFIALLGFSLFNPFLPLYMQQLGNLPTSKAAFWSGIATGCSGLMMFLSAPLWGILADRWGRKPQLLRAQFGGAVLIAAYILAPNIYAFVAMRALQGILTGTVTAAAALVATTTPRSQLPYSMSILMGAVFSGLTLGPFVGGMLADRVGFHTTFGVTSALLFAGGLVTFFLAREHFERPKAGEGTSIRGMFRLAFSSRIFPLLLVMCALNIGPQTVSPILALLVGEVSQGSNAASAAGTAMAVSGIITAISSFAAARLTGKITTRRLLVVCCLGTSLLYLPPIWAGNVAQLIIFVGLTGLFQGGIVSSSNSLVGLSVPAALQGVAYGLSQSANSLGSGLGPFLGGGLAPLIGLRAIFGVTAGIFLLVGLLSMRLLPDKAAPLPEEGETPA
jgi:DHA1 family multidrug resistance protein-like MFS transporter